MPITGYSDPIYDAIRAHLTANWTATDLQFPNEEYESIGPTPWVKVEIHGTDYSQMSIGESVQANNRWDQEGMLWLYLAIHRGTGLTQGRGAAKALANLFRGQSFLGGSLEFMDAAIGIGAPGDEEGPWYIIPVSIEWRRMND